MLIARSSSSVFSSSSFRIQSFLSHRLPSSSIVVPSTLPSLINGPSPLALTAASLSSSSSLSRTPTTYSSYPPSSSFHTSSVRSFATKNPFRSFLRSRIAVPEGSIGNQRTGGFDLFNQDNIPQDLQLPKPGDPFYRFGAAVCDGLLSCLGGISVGYLVYLGTHSSLDIAIPTGQATALVLWILRDALGDEGNRSIGKRLFNLELTNNDGTLVNTLYVGLLRNWYFALLPILSYHPLITMSFEVLLFFDAASFLLTPDARRVGDYMLGSRVVEELPNRTDRIRDMHELNEMQQIKEEIETLAPGTLAGLRNHPVYGKTVAGPWYDGIQAKLHADTVARLKAAKEEHAALKEKQSMVVQGEQLSNGGSSDGTDGKAATTTPSLSVGGGLGGLFSEVKGFQEKKDQHAEEASSSKRKETTGAGPQFLTYKPKKK